MCARTARRGRDEAEREEEAEERRRRVCDGRRRREEGGRGREREGGRTLEEEQAPVLKGRGGRERGAEEEWRKGERMSDGGQGGELGCYRSALAAWS